MNRKNERSKERRTMNDWFTKDRIDADTYIISEYRHWEETHCYLPVSYTHLTLPTSDLV